MLIQRWPDRSAAQQLNTQQLQDLEVAFFMQRSSLLRSIEALLTGSAAGSSQSQQITRIVTDALHHGLDKNLCISLANNFEQKLISMPHAAITSDQLANANYTDQKQQSQQHKQQLLLERDILSSLLITIFADWKPCTQDCLETLMPAMHLHMLSQSDTKGHNISASNRTACLVSLCMTVTHVIC